MCWTRLWAVCVALRGVWERAHDQQGAQRQRRREDNVILDASFHFKNPDTFLHHSDQDALTWSGRS